MKRLFCVVAGPRLGGKTTIAGTLPGKTLLLQAAVLESGSRSALKLARERGNKVAEVFRVPPAVVDASKRASWRRQSHITAKRSEQAVLVQAHDHGTRLFQLSFMEPGREFDLII